MPSQPSPPLEDVVIQKLRFYLLRLPLALLLVASTCALVAVGGVFIVKAAWKLVHYMVTQW